MKICDYAYTHSAQEFQEMHDLVRESYASVTNLTLAGAHYHHDFKYDCWHLATGENYSEMVTIPGRIEH